MSQSIRVLFLADTHLGLDLPQATRVKRRRRGHDFLANYAAALEPARAGEVDLVVHGGDVFDVPHVPASLGWQALEPLRRIAEAGVPVFIVPGNHERAAIPHVRFAAHPRVHVFDRPRTFVLDVRGTTLALAGFPYQRRGVRERFPALVAETGWTAAAADASLLCIHHCVEGATVGPADYTFRNADDVVRGRDIPSGFAAVLSGHIHRHQVLTRDLAGRTLAAPVLYPGSIERTALAEIGEVKGYMVLEVPADGGLATWEFRELPARPMIVRELAHDGMEVGALEEALAAVVASVPADAVLTIRITGLQDAADVRLPPAARLRALAPETMNVEIRVQGREFADRRAEDSPEGEQWGLGLGG